MGEHIEDQASNVRKWQVGDDTLAFRELLSIASELIKS